MTQNLPEDGASWGVHTQAEREGSRDDQSPSSNPTQTEDAATLAHQLTEDACLLRAWDKYELGRPVPPPLDYVAVSERIDQFVAMLSAAPTISPRGSEEERVARAIRRQEILSTSLPGMPEDVLQGAVDASWDCRLPEARAALAAPRGRGEGLEDALRLAISALETRAVTLSGLNLNITTALAQLRPALAALSSAPVSGGGGDRLRDAAPDLLEAAKLALPSGVCLTNSNIPDSTTIPLDATMGDLRRIAAAIAKALPPPPATGEVGT